MRRCTTSISVDTAIGGDPFQDTLRAEVYLKRGHAGDLDRAAASADAAIAAEPALVEGWFARLDVEVARERWPAALTAMDAIRRRFDLQLDDARLRASPGFAGLVASPEYAAWRARQARP